MFRLATLARLTGTTALKPSQPDFVGPHLSTTVHGARFELGKFFSLEASVNVWVGHQ